MPRSHALPRAHYRVLRGASPRRTVLAASAALLAAATLVLAGCADDAPTAPPGAAARAHPRAELTGVLDTTHWVTKMKMPAARSGLVAASVNGVIYAIGGARDSSYDAGDGVWQTADAPVRTVYAYYPNAGWVSWATKAQMPGRRAYANGATVINGKIYVSGGRYKKLGVDSVANSLFVYLTAENRWERKADMPARSFGGIQAAIGGKLYVVTHDFEGEPGDREHLYRYDPALDKWDELEPPPHPHWFGAGGAINGTLYAAGGYSVGESVSPAAVADLDVYNPATNSWSTKAPLPRGRGAAAARVTGGRLYVVGGRDGNTNLLRMDAYNPGSNTWARKTSLPASRHHAAGVVANGVLYVLGGKSTGFVAVRTNEAYDAP